MLNKIYPPELQLPKALRCSFRNLLLDLHVSISNVFMYPKIILNRDDIEFDKVNFRFSDGDFPFFNSDLAVRALHSCITWLCSHNLTA